MIFKKHIMIMAVLCAGFGTVPANADVEIGAPAPDFEALDAISGEMFKLGDHKGNIVVLEWTNKGCPFVQKHYGSGNMQRTQADALEMGGVEWVTIISSAPGKQGHVSAEEAVADIGEARSKATYKLLDESGDVGRAYGAQTTPHMYIINEEGVLVYAGAIDDNSSPNPVTIEGAENYVLSALGSLKAGEPIKVAQSRPYGCAVKY